MPYVKQVLRESIAYELDVINGQISALLSDPNNDRAGLLNYIFTSIIDKHYGPLSGAKYKDYNEAIGMLECCKLEFYRKAAAPYEDMKEKQNGKVLDGETRKPLKKSSEEQTKIIIFKVYIKPGIIAFIKSEDLGQAKLILSNILSSVEYFDVNINLIILKLEAYKEWDDLEPEVKNKFISNEQNGLSKDYVLILKLGDSTSIETTLTDTIINPSAFNQELFNKIKDRIITELNHWNKPYKSEAIRLESNLYNMGLDRSDILTILCEFSYEFNIPIDVEQMEIIKTISDLYKYFNKGERNGK